MKKLFLSLLAASALPSFGQSNEWHFTFNGLFCPGGEAHTFTNSVFPSAQSRVLDYSFTTTNSPPYTFAEYFDGIVGGRELEAHYTAGYTPSLAFVGVWLPSLCRGHTNEYPIGLWTLRETGWDGGTNYYSITTTNISLMPGSGWVGATWISQPTLTAPNVAPRVPLILFKVEGDLNGDLAPYLWSLQFRHGDEPWPNVPDVKPHKYPWQNDFFSPVLRWIADPGVVINVSVTPDLSTNFVYAATGYPDRFGYSEVDLENWTNYNALFFSLAITNGP